MASEATMLAELHTVAVYTADSGDAAMLEEMFEQARSTPGHSAALIFRIEYELEKIRSRGRPVADSAAVWDDLVRRGAVRLPPDDPAMLTARSLRAQYTRRRGLPGDIDRAIEMYRDEQRLREELFSADDPRTSTARANLALTIRERDRPGDLETARELLEREALFRIDRYGPDRPFTWIANIVFAQTLLLLADRADTDTRRDLARQAADLTRQMLQSRRRRYGDGHRSTLRAQIVYAHALLLLGQAEDAVAELREVQAVEGRGMLDPGWSDYLLARALRDIHPGRARTHAHRAVRLRSTSYLEGSRQLREAQRLVSELGD
ncbi:hypothetical protein ABGB12_34305 [Actinocorallia sp. B10E7]|uniref:hypothetical protein n=1 Tax=Actinocorallia sp. B10E7 TaxID=3153558 RepID=UPI00325F58A4